MKIIELTLHQHDHRLQDRSVAVAVSQIVSIGSFKYGTGDVVTELVMTTGQILSVTECYSDVLRMLRNSK